MLTCLANLAIHREIRIFERASILFILIVFHQSQKKPIYYLLQIQ